MPALLVCEFEATLARGNEISARGSGEHPARAAIETDMRHARNECRTSVVYVCPDSRVDPHKGPIVEESPAVPESAVEAKAVVSEAVIDTAVESYARSPVPRMPDVDPVHPAPIPRGPQQSDLGRQYPSSRHPVISGGSPGPIAGYPHIADGRTRGLDINRQGWRRDIDGYPNEYSGGGHDREHGEHEHDK